MTFDIKKLSKILAMGILMLPCLLHAQQIDPLLNLYFNEVRAGKYPAIPKQFSLAENAKDVLTAVSVYQQDTTAEVRAKAYTITQLAGQNARQTQLRTLAVSQLVQACKDNDSGNAGLALDYLKAFRKEDFTAMARDSIRSLFKSKPAHFDQLLKLVGFLEITDLKEDIRPYTQPGTAQSNRWAAIVSLARMGDHAAADEMMRRARKLPVNDDVIYKIFPDLAYTRHRNAIAYMVEVLYREENECRSADAEKETLIPCGYRVMEQLAPVIDGYPLELDESGDVKTKDYVTALKTVREWFQKHKNYKIQRDTY